VLLTYKDENILFDCGEGTQKQFRIAELNPCRLLEYLLRTGMEIMYLVYLDYSKLNVNNYSKTLFIYGPRGTKHFLGKYIEFL
jgi:ribonuclease BN (tRNA processing enzyme)